MALIYVIDDYKIEFVKQSVKTILSEYIKISSNPDYISNVLTFDVVYAQYLIDNYGKNNPIVCSWNDHVFIIDSNKIYGTAPYIDDDKLIKIITRSL